jgi:hypothetical protein
MGVGRLVRLRELRGPFPIELASVFRARGDWPPHGSLVGLRVCISCSALRTQSLVFGAQIYDYPISAFRVAPYRLGSRSSGPISQSGSETTRLPCSP